MKLYFKINRHLYLKKMKPQQIEGYLYAGFLPHIQTYIASKKRKYGENGTSCLQLGLYKK